MQYRHGDVMVEKVKSIPTNAKKLNHLTLAHGEVTGHSHQIKPRKNAELYNAPSGLFLKVTAESADLVHEEHATIALPKGIYRVWRQREYSPEEIRIIRD